MSLIPANIIIYCIKELVTRNSNLNEENYEDKLEAACILLSTIGTITDKLAEDFT